MDSSALSLRAEDLLRTLVKGPGADGAIEGPIGFPIGPLPSLIMGGKASHDRGPLKWSQLRMHKESLGRRRPRDAVGIAWRTFTSVRGRA